MITETEGIVLRQTKLLNGRRMIVLFSQKFGKISAASSLSEKNRTKSALALRPFCRGQYELFKGRDSYSINSALVLESYYALGEDVDRYMAASSVLELTAAMLGEEEAQPDLYRLLCSYLSLAAARRKDFATPGLAFELKALQLMGSGISIKNCMRCGKAAQAGDTVLSVRDGGLVCRSCQKPEERTDPLLFTMSDDILSAIGFLLMHPLQDLEKLSLPKSTAEKLSGFLRIYRAEHLGIERLKSDGLF